MGHSKKKFWPTKLALGIVSAATVAFVGMTGVASANGNGNGHNNGNGHTPTPSMNGYGGGHNVDVNLDLDVSGDNNVINVVIHFIFG